MAYNANMNVADIRAGLLAGDFTAREITEASFKRIEELDGEVHAFLELTKDAAFEQAAKIDEALANGTFDEMGPLAGVPVAFKDNMNYEGTHTTCSSLMLENYVSPYTATCVAKTIEAGGIPLGKLNMDEFAFGSSTETSAFGPTKNPWDLERVPGGSSGGSAASVAAGLGVRHARFRHGWIHSPACSVLRHCWREADLWHGFALWRGCVRQLA